MHNLRPLQNPTNAVIPAYTLWGTGAGIHKWLILLDSGLRRNDETGLHGTFAKVLIWDNIPWIKKIKKGEKHPLFL
jgi:hypothetical protein